MVRNAFVVGCLMLVAAAAGCYTGTGVDINATPKQTSDGTAPPDGTGTGAQGDLPCDVAQVLQSSCTSCHGSPLAGGAPNAMLVRDDLLAASKSDPTQSVLALSIQRMQDTTRPMPPSGGAAAADIAVLQSWLNAGTPAGTCGGTSTSGTSSAPVCTSGTTWTRGNRGSSAMRPGGACIDCHSRGDGPMYSLAGTLYPTMHEPDDCNGTNAAQVVIMDAKGNTVVTLTPNSVGNFYSGTTLPSPYRAKVIVGGKVREMVTPQTNGDCNTCHSATGAQSAPGRVAVP